jgi:hypothetical protein
MLQFTAEMTDHTTVGRRPLKPASKRYPAPAFAQVSAIVIGNSVIEIVEID